jgi:hypothetical protein
VSLNRQFIICPQWAATLLFERYELDDARDYNQVESCAGQTYFARTPAPAAAMLARGGSWATGTDEKVAKLNPPRTKRTTALSADDSSIAMDLSFNIHKSVLG